MKRSIIVAAIAALTLAAPAAALADQPDGSVVSKANDKIAHTNVVAENSSRIIQNGQFVGGNSGGDQWWQDQTSAPHSRGAYVQELQASQDRGSLSN